MIKFYNCDIKLEIKILKLVSQTKNLIFSIIFCFVIANLLLLINYEKKNII